MHVKTRALTTVALFVALIFMLSLIKFNIGPVPITLQTLGVMLAGVVLGSRKGFVATAVYALMLFPNIAGPTGGFIISFPFAALLIGLAVERFGRSRRVIALSCTVFGIGLVYALGAPWFQAVTGMNWQATFTYAVIPFIPGDLMKVALTAVLADRLPLNFSDYF